MTRPCLNSCICHIGLALASVALGAGYGAQARAEEAPGLSYYGVPGYLTMPSGFALPDGVFALSVATQGNMIRRGNLAFQISPRVTGVFRYGYLEDFNIYEGGISLYDRSFDVIFHLADEDPEGWRPAVALGLQDFGGQESMVPNIWWRAAISGRVSPPRRGSAGGAWAAMAVLTTRFR